MGKPFIKLLHTINAGYFYDVNRNQLVDVSEESYQYLQDLLADKEVGTEPEEIAYLKQAGYLSDHHVEKIEHPETRNLPYILERKVQKITLQLTQQCNFRCKYCVYSATDANLNQRHHTNLYMSEEVALKAVDFLADHSIDSEAVNIGLYGGEPLLAFPLVKKIVAYAQKKFATKKLTFAMTSNASLLTEEIVKFLADNQIDLMISLDGPKEIQDKNRVFSDGKTGTFDIVRQNLIMVQEKFPDYFEKLSINMVVDPRNSFELVRSLENDPVLGKVRTNISMMETDSMEEAVQSEPDFTMEYEYMEFLADLAYLKRLDEKKLPGVMQMSYAGKQSLYKKLNKGISSIAQAAPGGPCLPGQKRPFVDVKGNIFPCERVSETSECMKIGTLNAGFDLEKCNALLNVAKLSVEKCRNCWAFTLCGQCARMANKNGILTYLSRIQNCRSILANVQDDLYTLLLVREMSRYI